MTNIILAIPKKIVGLFICVLSLFKRVICRIQRGRKNSGTLLPLHNKFSSPDSIEVQHSVPENEVELQAWDSWGREDQQQQHGEATSPLDSKHMPNDNTSNNVQSVTSTNRNSVGQEEEEEPAIDYFQDMVPDVKKPAKILIRKKENLNYMAAAGGGLSSRLVMAGEVPSHGADLEAWEDENAGGWEDSATESTAWEADAAIREKKKLEREKRLLEHQRKKMERDTQRLSKKDGSHLTAVKLS